MLNQVVCVGRIASIKRNEYDDNQVNMKITIPRSYKNDNGEYDTDIIPINLYSEIAKNTIEYCKVGDIVGIKGRLINIMDLIEIQAERVTFLSSNSSNKEED